MNVFIHLQTAKPLDPYPGQVMAACVADLCGAEGCVAFAASREDLGYFRIAFDFMLAGKAMKKSALPCKEESTGFMIFEERK